MNSLKCLACALLDLSDHRTSGSETTASSCWDASGGCSALLCSTQLACANTAHQGLYTARARAHPPPPPPPRLGRAPGSNSPGGPRRRKQSRGPHRSRRQPTPLPGLRCGTRLARRAAYFLLWRGFVVRYRLRALSFFLAAWRGFAFLFATGLATGRC
jgi:hypothetical protein